MRTANVRRDRRAEALRTCLAVLVAYMIAAVILGGALLALIGTLR